MSGTDHPEELSGDSAPATGESASLTNPWSAPPQLHQAADDPATPGRAGSVDGPTPADTNIEQLERSARPRIMARLAQRHRVAAESVRAIRRPRLAPATGAVFHPSRFAWAGQVLRSTLLSVVRNGPLTVAGILCASVALSLVGTSLLVSEGVSNATIRWRGGVETIVFVEPGASQSFIDDVGDELTANPSVAEITFVSQDDAFEEFQVMFRNSPELVDSIKATDLPASWRVVPNPDATTEAVAAIGDPFAERDGIFQVVYARDAVASVMNVSRVIRLGLVGLAVTLGAAAWLLVWTTCRTAAWARRDELSVMRLVGAPRWLVRLPFMLEGALQGLVGGLVGSAAVFALAEILERKVVEGDSLAILRNFSVEGGAVLHICLLLAVGGIIAGAAAATLAVGRYVAAGDGVPVTLRGRSAAALRQRVRHARKPDAAAL